VNLQKCVLMGDVVTSCFIVHSTPSRDSYLVSRLVTRDSRSGGRLDSWLETLNQ
jgi:hypothetical protein